MSSHQKFATGPLGWAFPSRKSDDIDSASLAGRKQNINVLCLFHGKVTFDLPPPPPSPLPPQKKKKEEEAKTKTETPKTTNNKQTNNNNNNTKSAGEHLLIIFHLYCLTITTDSPCHDLFSDKPCYQCAWITHSHQVLYTE